ncbi:MAG: SpoIID/LytB domain-containing protein [Bacillota bacterium]
MRGCFVTRHKFLWMGFKAASLLVLLVYLISNVNITANAYANIPEKVRIGLYFNDSQTKQNSAVTSFIVDAGSGIQLGSFQNNVFTVLVEETTSAAVTIRKDAFFVKGSSGLTEYNPSSTPIPGGERVGAYHIKIGEDFADLKSLNTKLQEIKQKGIDAYPAYVDKWQIWTGFYVDENDAQMSILYSLEPVLGSNNYQIVNPSPTRITAISKTGQVMLMFDSAAAVFQVHPSPKNVPNVLRINSDDKKRFRGGLEVRRLTGSDMTVINVVPTEQYLYGVVPYEIEASSHPEALKAQAVAARTYTLNNMKKYSRLDFNLCTTVYSQVYKGFAGETVSTNKAVDDTKGKILTYNGKPAAVFYFSSSGGRTEDVKNVWGSSDYPYLKSVEDKYESGKSWRYTWEVTYTAQKIKQIMTERGFNLGDIVGIYITKKSEAGRATELVVKGTKDQRIYTNGSTRSFLSLDSQWYTISTDADVTVKGQGSEPLKTQLAGKKVMTASGLKTINSTSNSVSIVSSGNVKRTVALVPTTYTFTGRGWGHAVGMSQEGAKGMANAGFKYEQILTHYFTGTKVE